MVKGGGTSPRGCEFESQHQILDAEESCVNNKILNVRKKNSSHWLEASLVKWLKEEAHIREVISSNPSTRYWMDKLITLICCKIVLMFEKTENKLKRGRGWPIYLKKKNGWRQWLQITRFFRFLEGTVR